MQKTKYLGTGFSFQGYCLRGHKVLWFSFIIWYCCRYNYGRCVYSTVLTFWHRSFTFNSNKLPTWCNNFSVYYPDVCLQLNMFRAFPPTHHQELNDCTGSLWFYLRIVVTDVLCSWSGRPAGPTTNTTRLSPRYEGKTRGCHSSHWAPDDGWGETPETCWAVNKRQGNKLKNCCIMLVIYLN
jgi:hypothetical protein